VKTIALYDIKGGVGKTAVCVKLAYSYAKSALLWDLDSQGAASYNFNMTFEEICNVHSQRQE